MTSRWSTTTAPVTTDTKARFKTKLASFVQRCNFSSAAFRGTIKVHEGDTTPRAPWMIDPPAPPCGDYRFETLKPRLGTSKKNRLVGGSGTNVLYGLGGADTLDGRGGADCLDGGAAADKVNGGPGDDVLRGGDGADGCSAAPGVTS